jgi:glycosyltransferase involved in cell wall biosynthesis
MCILTALLVFSIDSLQYMPFPDCTAVFAPVLVSILMPTYNKGIYIARSIKSAIAQSYPHIEIVISDDASDDKTLQVVRRYQSHDQRVRYWRNEKQVYTHTNRVYAVRRSTGRFLLSLDSDDELCNRTAEIDLQAAFAWQADMVEHQALQFTTKIGFELWTFRPPGFVEGNNNTLTRAFRRGRLNWNLWLKMSHRRLYVNAIDLLGPSVCDLMIQITVDQLHLAVMYRFVKKYIVISYIGYIYYRNVRENTMFRTHNKSAQYRLVRALIVEAYRAVI